MAYSTCSVLRKLQCAEGQWVPFNYRIAILRIWVTDLGSLTDRIAVPPWQRNDCTYTYSGANDIIWQGSDLNIVGDTNGPESTQPSHKENGQHSRAA